MTPTTTPMTTGVTARRTRMTKTRTATMTTMTTMTTSSTAAGRRARAGTDLTTISTTMTMISTTATMTLTTTTSSLRRSERARRRSRAPASLTSWLGISPRLCRPPTLVLPLSRWSRTSSGKWTSSETGCCELTRSASLSSPLGTEGRFRLRPQGSDSSPAGEARSTSTALRRLSDRLTGRLSTAVGATTSPGLRSLTRSSAPSLVTSRR
mmetsp:Transcript_6145/g.12767  ORF Transcript_6145/g.12767 Transcript_6145/m.12767 type:complete len:210 (+) Transcript_6145:494-1123(+)